MVCSRSVREAGACAAAAPQRWCLLPRPPNTSPPTPPLEPGEPPADGHARPPKMVDSRTAPRGSQSIKAAGLCRRFMTMLRSVRVQRPGRRHSQDAGRRHETGARPEPEDGEGGAPEHDGVEGCDPAEQRLDEPGGSKRHDEADGQTRGDRPQSCAHTWRAMRPRVAPRAIRMANSRRRRTTRWDTVPKTPRQTSTSPETAKPAVTCNRNRRVRTVVEDLAVAGGGLVRTARREGARGARRRTPPQPPAPMTARSRARRRSSRRRRRGSFSRRSTRRPGRAPGPGAALGHALQSMILTGDLNGRSRRIRCRRLRTLEHRNAGCDNRSSP